MKKSKLLKVSLVVTSLLTISTQVCYAGWIDQAVKVAGKYLLKKGARVIPVVGNALTAYEIIDKLLGSEAKAAAISSPQLKDNILTSAYYFDIGNAEFDADNYEQAIKNYKMSIQLYPDSRGSYHNIGICYENLGDISTAKKYYNHACNMGFSESCAEL